MPRIDEKAYVNPEAFRFLEQPATATDTEPIDAKELKPPKVIIPLTNVDNVEGQPIVLACKISGTPKPYVCFSHFFVFVFDISLTDLFKITLYF